MIKVYRNEGIRRPENLVGAHFKRISRTNIPPLYATCRSSFSRMHDVNPPLPVTKSGFPPPIPTFPKRHPYLDSGAMAELQLAYRATLVVFTNSQILHGSLSFHFLDLDFVDTKLYLTHSKVNVTNVHRKQTHISHYRCYLIHFFIQPASCCDIFFSSQISHCDYRVRNSCLSFYTDLQRLSSLLQSQLSAIGIDCHSLKFFY